MLKKAKVLKKGDTVCTVSSSWGGAGDADLRFRYERQLKNEKTQTRTADLNAAFANPEIKAIFSCIGGSDSVRMLPYLDWDVIIANPKIYIGYSDSTITHLICHKAGFTSFYGPSILAEFAENI